MKKLALQEETPIGAYLSSADEVSSASPAISSVSSGASSTPCDPSYSYVIAHGKAIPLG